ncbi:hypothetical protein [Bdellovibrio sp. HCB209]|uniref:hypothetical protein n=1 Tax=Bdellovibrio sp. HCB209 TaxID=3394354 RepID=UPI0039B6772A
MKKLVTMTLIGMQTAAQIASAAPAEVYDRLTYYNPTNSPVLRDNVKTRDTLWVLPPSEGTISEPKYDFYVSPAECQGHNERLQGLYEYEKYTRKLMQQMDQIKDSLIATGADPEAHEKAARTSAILEAQLEKYQVRADKMRKEFAAEAGGIIRAYYTTPWEANVSAIANSNPQFRDVRKLDGKNMIIKMDIPDMGADSSTLPLIRDFSINGINRRDLANSPTATAGGSLVAEIAVTKVAACFLKFPNLFGKDDTPKYTVSTVYDIPRSFSFHVKAKINYWNVYKYLNEKGSKGGFFSSSSYNRTLEEDWGGSAFTIDWQSEDPESKLTDEQRFRMTMEIKSYLAENIANIIGQKMGLKITQADAAGENGAAATAKALEKVPNPKAQMAALALKALNAIFGSSSQSTQYEQRLNRVETFEMNSDTARYEKYSTVYK